MQKPFILNRTEEFGQDIWDSYVLPPYFLDLGLSEARKSVVIEGGRGCGKTALLRYLSCHSQFSKNRSHLPDASLNTIGLYLKADSQYFSAFIGGGIEERKWQDIFEHALCLALAEQVVAAINAINCNADRQVRFGGIERLDFYSAIGGLSNNPIPKTLKEFETWLRKQRQMLSHWFKNFDESKPPELFGLHEFIFGIIHELREKLPYLSNSVFAVYIDEYENLLDYQQKFLNTLIKSGEPPLIFHIAMKPNGMRTRLTLGTEAIQEVGDFRRLILDDELEPDFELFAAELILFRLIRAGLPEEESPVTRGKLQDENEIESRRADQGYREQVLSEARRILPGVRNAVVATLVLDDETLYKRWRKLLEEGLKLKGSGLVPDDFLDRAYPEASVVSIALLHQSSKKAEEVLEEFTKLQSGKVSRFKEGDWIHHFLMGTLLLIYLPYRQRPCPLYAGFDSFVKLSKTNVRHFLELCHLSIGNFDAHGEFGNFSVPINTQAEAAFRASRNFKEEVSGCGDLGNRLLSIVNFLGRLFRLSQNRPSQSEPERTHFSITNEEVSSEAQKVLGEAIKWSVLFKEPESKVKGVRYESSEYILNPIYAPFFGISYNKGRKLEIPAGQAEIILAGETEEFTSLLKQYEKQWASNISGQYTLGLEAD